MTAMIEMKGVSRRYPDGREALKGVCLSIDLGEMVFLGGASGAGKTTLLRVMAGIDTPQQGSVKLNGQDITRLSRPAREALRQNIGLVFQDHHLLMNRSVEDNLALPLRIQGFSNEDIRKRVGTALERVGLGGQQKNVPSRLSGGERQRLCIARALVGKPALIIADEPSASLDADYSEAILNLFRSFHASGVTLVIATHDERWMDGLQGRLIHLDQGQVINAGEAP